MSVCSSTNSQKHFLGQQTGNFTNVFPSHLHPIHKSTSALIFIVELPSDSEFLFPLLGIYFLYVTSFSEAYFQRKKLNVRKLARDQLSGKNQIFKLWGKCEQFWISIKIPKGHSGGKSQFGTARKPRFQVSLLPELWNNLW